MKYKEEIIPDHELNIQWGVRAGTVNGVDYPEQVLAEVEPYFYEENGEPIFCDEDLGEGDQDQRIRDGDVMEYLRTVRVTEEAI